MMIPLLNNPLITGGAFLGLTGSIVASLRNVPSIVYKWVKRQVVTSVEIRSDSEAYRWLIEWLDQHPYSKKSRALSVGVKRNNETITFTPAPGGHFLRYKGVPIWFNRSIKEKELGGFTETMNLTALTRKQSVFRDLLLEARTISAQSEAVKTIVYVNSSWNWDEVNRNDPRPIESVVSDQAQDVLDDIKHFLNNKAWYESVGVPYRRGYLFYGPPGNGKSSLARAVAGANNMSLSVLNLSSKQLDDEKLLYLLAKAPERTIVLLEDADAAFTQREKTDENCSRVTMSGLLNAIDGVAVRDGQIVIVTTNHIDKLDPAFIRPGRIDKRVFMDNATRYQAIEMFHRFAPDASKDDAEEFASTHVGKSMAAIQNDLLVRFSR